MPEMRPKVKMVARMTKNGRPSEVPKHRKPWPHLRQTWDPYCLDLVALAVSLPPENNFGALTSATWSVLAGLFALHAFYFTPSLITRHVKLILAIFMK